jgi:hypothetical protein
LIFFFFYREKSRDGEIESMIFYFLVEISILHDGAHNGNDGILEKWNDGMAPFGQINACGRGLKAHWFRLHFLP